MNQRNNLYPPTPQQVPASITEPSPAFKTQVSGVMGSILLFFIVYLIMFLLALGLVAACVVGGIALMGALRNLYGLLFGIGLIGVGIMVMIFLVKFLFAVSKFDRTGTIEITEAEQPALFAFIRKLTDETQTVFPKRIYLSPDVNACVFYDSSFWSMFLPIKKNLQIGLGLVNTLNLSEFKVVMAHEFGHFSQRSMKLGSFVYQVNRVIYNMLYDNNSYGSFLQGWANISGVFAFFANVTVKIIQAIQWVLRKMYGVINKSYMSLSREMEFHADAVAASVSGGNNLVTALRRVELGDYGYNIVINKYNELIKDKKLGKNLYPDQRVVLQQLAKDNKLRVEDGLPVVESKSFESQQFNRVNFKDQWASHPTTDERETYLNSLGVEVPPNAESAWVLFSNQQQLQEMATGKVFEAIDATGFTTIDNQDFADLYGKEESFYSLPEQYNGFYHGREITILEESDLQVLPSSALPGFDQVYSLENAQLTKKINGAASDIELLKAIAAKQIDTKTFDFEGKKYKANEAGEVQAQIGREKEAWEQELKRLDKLAVQYQLTVSDSRFDQVKTNYLQYFVCREESAAYLEQVNKMIDELRPIYAGETQSFELINQQIEHLKLVSEPEFKKFLSNWDNDGVFDQNSSLKEKVRAFVNANYAYFSGSSFFENELSDLYHLVNDVWSERFKYQFGKFKELVTV